MAAPYLIHIGYSKTATTWLQEHYFTRREAGFAFVRESKATVSGGIGGYSPGHYIIERPLFHYDPLVVRREVDELFAADLAAGRTPIISYEQLSGSPSAGGWPASELAWRLASSFPDARILIVVREQRAMIRSCYMQYLRSGGTMSLGQYMAGPKDGQVPQPDLHYFRYEGLLRHYLSLFPRSQVLCLPYELLRDRPAEFLAALDAFAGVTPARNLPLNRRSNATVGMLEYLIWRWINPFVHPRSLNGPSPYGLDFLRRPVKRALRQLSRLLPRSWDRMLLSRWERQIEARTAGFYEESNRRLARLIDFDLRQFGWRVAADVPQSDTRDSQPPRHEPAHGYWPGISRASGGATASRRGS
jgi:hypothetical protein